VSEDKPSDSSKQEAEVPERDSSGAAEAERFFRFIRERTHELKTGGMSEGQARDTAMLEERISRWPPEWGNELVVLLYGDFRPPEKPLHFADLGIIIEAENISGSVIVSAMCVLKARVTVKDKNVAGLTDAAERLNTLLGICSVVDWGNCGSGWWCQVTHGSLGGMSPAFDQEAIEAVTNQMTLLQPNVRRKVNAALYWIREPRRLMREGYRSDLLRVYAGYWNAFECLVDAVGILQPHDKVTKKEKQDQIDHFVAASGGKLSVSDISDCYRSFVDPGFVAKASHALRICFPDKDQYERYIVECFKAKPEQDRLYNIRNAINHGDINADDLQELIRVEDKHRRLWMIVFGMLGLFIPTKRPLDSEAV
jgi:hypothetical protein